MMALIGKAKVGPSFFVKWDKERRIAVIHIGGDEWHFVDMELMLATEERGVISWQGKVLSINKVDYDDFGHRFPNLDLNAELRKADGWLAERKRPYKDHYRFMLNWLKRADKPKLVY